MGLNERRLLSRRRDAQGSRRGYSLVEALVVLGMASVLLLTAMPNAFELFHRYALWVAAYKLAGEMQKARMLAIAGNTRVRLQCDPDASRYQLVESTAAPVAAEHYLPNRIRFASLPRAAIGFHARGTAAPAGSITLAGRGGRARVVVSVSGRVRMELLDRTEDPE